MPHHKKVTPQEWERYAGRAGYLKNQGFYVYRQKRLIIHGTWFGLARQTELTKLARVRIDMPNGLDVEWKIDVKKASAQPPFQVRERLRRIIETIGATSKRVYTARGRVLVTDSRLPVWNRRSGQERNFLPASIQSHPVLADFVRKAFPTSNETAFVRVIDLLGIIASDGCAVCRPWRRARQGDGHARFRTKRCAHVVATTIGKLLEAA